MMINPMRVRFEAWWRAAHGPKLERDMRIERGLWVDYALPSCRLAILIDKRRFHSGDDRAEQAMSVRLKAVQGAGWRAVPIMHGTGREYVVKLAGACCEI